MNTIHETVFCRNPKNNAIVSAISRGNFVGYAGQDKDLNEQYREYKKSALEVTRNGQASIHRSICVEKLH